MARTLRQSFTQKASCTDIVHHLHVPQGPVTTAHLLLQFSKDAYLQHAKLVDSEVDIQDIANEVSSGHRPLTFAVSVKIQAENPSSLADAVVNASICVWQIREIFARIHQPKTNL